MTRVLVTGASGFLGGHLVEALVDRGDEVVAMVRGSSDTSLLESLGVEMRVGDVTDPASLDDATRGVEAVYHLAAYYTFHGSWDRYLEVNVEGTRALMEAAVDNGVRRFVHCSTTETIGATPQGLADERSPLSPDYDYGRSKAESERVAMSYGDRIEVSVVRPSGIYGPRNLDDVSYYFITSFSGPLSKFVIGNGEAKIQFVHVKDVVQGLLLSMESGEAAGETFIITDSEAYSYNEVYRILAEVMGIPAPRWHLPVWMAKLFIAPVELVNRARRRDNFIWHLDTLRALSSDRYYSIEKAGRVLGYSPKHCLKDGLRETVEWYRENGILKD